MCANDRYVTLVRNKIRQIADSEGVSDRREAFHMHPRNGGDNGVSLEAGRSGNEILLGYFDTVQCPGNTNKTEKPFVVVVVVVVHWRYCLGVKR